MLSERNSEELQECTGHLELKENYRWKTLMNYHNYVIPT